MVHRPLERCFDAVVFLVDWNRRERGTISAVLSESLRWVSNRHDTRGLFEVASAGDRPGHVCIFFILPSLSLC